MATLTVTIPDAIVPRVRAAFSKGTNPATVAEVEQAIKSFLKLQVRLAEASKAAEDKQTAVEQEVW